MSEHLFRTAVVPAAHRAAAQAHMGAGTFMTGLSSDGQLPASHYITSGLDAETAWLDVAALEGADVSDDAPEQAEARLALMRTPWPDTDD